MNKNKILAEDIEVDNDWDIDYKFETDEDGVLWAIERTAEEKDILLNK
jgi:hypothetical protein